MACLFWLIGVFRPPWRGVLTTKTHFDFLLWPAFLTLRGVAGDLTVKLHGHFACTPHPLQAHRPEHRYLQGGGLPAYSPPPLQGTPLLGGPGALLLGPCFAPACPALAGTQPSLLRSHVNTTRGYLSASFPQLQVISAVLLNVSV